MPKMRIHAEGGKMRSLNLVFELRKRFVCPLCGVNASKCDDPDGHDFEWMLSYFAFKKICKMEGYKHERTERI